MFIYSYPGLVPENEVITACVIFFVMGLVIEMFKCSNVQMVCFAALNTMFISWVGA